MLTLELIIMAAILVLGVWQRKNKFVFWGIWLATLILFFAAANQPSPESLGRQVFKKIGEPSGQEKEIRNYYISSADKLTGTPEDKPAQPEKEKPTWFWWRLCSYALACALIMTTLQIFDDLKTGSKKVLGISKEAWRRQKITFKKGWTEWKDFRLKKQEIKARVGQMTQAVQAASAPKEQLASNNKKPSFRELFLPSLTAEATWDVIAKLSSKLYHKLLTRI